jgi:hypothetical protein
MSAIMEVDILSAADRDSIVDDHMRDYLESVGLSRIAPRRWIDGTVPPARRLFEFQLLKGAGLKACWGFSLDFVPHIAGGRVTWHRSDKAAKLDVIVDPRMLPQPSFLWGANKLKEDLAAMAPAAVAAAKRDWQRGTTYEGMLQIIRDIRDQHTNCFDYHNYTQLPLAFAYLAAKVGEPEAAKQELDQYIKDFQLDEIEAEKLHRHLVEAY